MKKLYNILSILLVLALNVHAKDGLFVEFKLTSKNINGDVKTYALDGSTRSESTMQTSQGQSMSVVVLALKQNPGVVYMLNEAGKTYSENDATKTYAHEQHDYEVTVLGKERVNNYNCTHVKVLDKNTQKVMELWLSKDIVNYTRYAATKSRYFSGKLFTALRAQGADGYVVRMTSNDERAGQIEMDLVKAESRDIDASKFTLDGYTKSASMAPAGAPSMPDAKAIQNMTPEERQQYIQQMKDKYQQH